MAYFLVTTTDWPIVHITYPAQASVADVEELTRKMRGIYAKAAGAASPVVTIADLSAVSDYPSDVRKRLAESGNASFVDFPGGKAGEAVVATSQLVRAGIRAHYLFRKKSGIATGVFATKQEAFSWAIALLKGDRKAS